jgi:hypothetical protein
MLRYRRGPDAMRGPKPKRSLLWLIVGVLAIWAVAWAIFAIVVALGSA